MSRTNNPILRQTVLIDFEALEIRKLLSTVNITSFGARPNDGGDDAGAIQAAINASSPGDTVYFPAGTFDVRSASLRLKGDRSYRGEGDATLLKGDPNGRHIFWIQQDNTRVENFQLDGKPVFIDTPNGQMVSGLLLNNNTIRMHAGGENNNGVTFTTGLRNSTISNNTFDPMQGANGIWGYYWDNLRIANNEFINGPEGIHINDLGSSSKDLLIEQNYFAGIRGMGIEYQGAGDRSVIQDNYYEKPVLSSNFPENDSTFAYSLIADRSSNMIVRRNTVIAPERPDGVGVRMAFEIGGDNTLVEQNYINGVNHVLAACDYNGSTSVLCRDNKYLNVLQGPAGRNLTLINNGPNVQLNWDINRGKPGRNRSFGGGTTPPPQPPPPPPANDGTTSLADLNWTGMSNGWGPAEKNRSNGEANPNDGNTLKVHGTSYARGLGTHAGSEITYNLAGQYTRFFSDIGIDDEVGNRGSVAFQVWADGDKLFDSGKITGSTPTQQVNVDVSGRNSLRLVVTDGGDGNAFDHADWANARLAKGSQPPPDPSPNPDPAPAPDPGPAPSNDGTTSLADLNWTGMSNGWGPAEKNRSNGEANPNDGNTLKVHGTSYARGLGTHAGSEITYNLAGQYTRFFSDIGIDDEVGNRGSVAFQVWADGDKLFDSGKITGSTPTQQVNVDVSGRNSLRLVVTDGGDGNAFDHADWANARLAKGNQPPPPPPPPSSGGTGWLSDLKWASAVNGWGDAEKDRSNGEFGGSDGRTITIGGQTYAKGIGVHASSDIRFNLDGSYKSFQSDVGIDDEVGNAGSAVFQVWADGALKYDSGTVRGADGAKQVSVDLTGAKELRLVVKDAGDGNAFDHADWAGAKLS